MRLNTVKTGLKAAVFGFLLTAGSMAQIRINEFLADNVSVNPDNYDFDDFSDWLELHNAGNAPVDIGGYYLTDELSEPRKWKIPEGTALPADGYLLIWTDDFDGEPGQQETREWYPWTETYSLKGYHAVFKLDKEGEEIGLFDASGTLVDSVSFGQQFHDVSMGRTDDGAWAFFDAPTPGSANSTTAKQLGISELCGDVTFSVEGGMYKTGQTVSLSAANGEVIHYTLDGSIPYPDDRKYSAPISINSSAIIRARAFSSDKFGGRVITNTYFIGEKARTMMVVSLTTDPAFLNDKDFGIWENNMKGREVPCAVECFTTDGNRVARFNAGVRNGTLTSFMEAQHPMQIALRDRYGDQFVEYRFFDKPITTFNRFRLRQGGDVWSTNFIGDAVLDPLNKGQTEVGIQAFRPVVVYVNGDYYGIMNLREQFKEQYFVENYGVDASDRDEVRSILMPSSGGGIMGVSYKEDWELMVGDWNSYRSLTSSLKSESVDESRFNALRDIINIASFSDFFILVGFGDGISWTHNQDMWKLPEGKWQWLVTDFDRCWTYQSTGFTSGGVDHNLFPEFAADDSIFPYLIENPQFKQYFVQRFAAHLNSTLRPERLTAIVDSIEALVEPEMADHAALWSREGGISSVSSWKDDVDDVRKFMNERSDYCWEQLAEPPFSVNNTRSKLSVTVSPAAAEAEIRINGVPLTYRLKNIELFGGIPFDLSASGKGEWKFKKWGTGEVDDTLSVTLSGDKAITAIFEQLKVGSQSEPVAVRKSGETCLIRLDENGYLNGTVSSVITENNPLNVTIFSINGRKIKTSVFQKRSMGEKTTIHIPLKKEAGGLYIYRLSSGKWNRTGTVHLR